MLIVGNHSAVCDFERRCFIVSAPGGASEEVAFEAKDESAELLLVWNNAIAEYFSLFLGAHWVQVCYACAHAAPEGWTVPLPTDRWGPKNSDKPESL